MFIVLVSKKGSRSKWVHSEIGIAIANNKRIIPIIEKGESIPDPLLGREYIEYDPNKPKDALKSLDDFLSKQEQKFEAVEEKNLVTSEPPQLPDLSGTIIAVVLAIFAIVIFATLLSRR